MDNYGYEYTFTARVWCSGWYFVSLPKEMAEEIRVNFKYLEEGWGRLKATSKVGKSEWKTAIWFDTKHETYLLPIKSDIRKREHINVEDEIKVTIWI